ncbi:MAG: chemotaxis protein CheV [Desulfuromonadaceae bacterium]|nr:chemotaxis protein CheV [Desulfuromonadaceae bacterium]
MTNDATLQEVLTRTSLSSSNQMEMLTFRLTDRQLYGINVFKIIEIIECPARLDRIPHSHPAIRGVVNFRGQAISVIDLSQALDMTPVNFQHDIGYLVVCEYNNQLNAFLVASPEILLTRSWEDIKKPDGFDAPALVAIAYDDQGEMVLLLDIEGILAEIVGLPTVIETSLLEEGKRRGQDKHVLLVDDSSSALLMMKNTLTELGMSITQFDSAVKALEAMTDPETRSDLLPVNLIISDIEMPGMDGFTFTRSIRSIAEMSALPIILHSSMSNPTNELKAREAGATAFIAKFDPNVLVKQVLQSIA